MSLFKAKKSDLGFVMEKKEVFYKYLDNLKPGDYVVEIMSVADQRSKVQNRTIHHIAEVVAKDLGETTQYMKEIWAQAFIGTKDVFNPIIMRTVERAESTSDLSVEEGYKFIQDIINWTIENLRYNPLTKEVIQ